VLASSRLRRAGLAWAKRYGDFMRCHHFSIDNRFSDVIIPAYNKRFGGVNPKWRSKKEIFVKTNLSR
jgi:hypothetical protein